MGVLRWFGPEDFRWILDPGQPWVWVPRWADASLRRWGSARLPLGPSSVDVEARFPTVDLQLSTDAFLARFLTAELWLQPVFQMTRRVPDTLWYEKLAPENLYPVLLQNGLHLHAELTYDDELLLAAPERSTLERIWQAAAGR